ncbi:MAG: SEL1-like repeat protein [Burkholderiales bacterium]|nr:SEL1-like repeat protein [Burkholderiales bacterium]
MRTRIVATMLLALAALPAHAGWEDAVKAYQNGDYATAAKEFRPFAEQGQATAQYILGWIYQTGEGVTQDYAEAAKWYQKAAEKGNGDAQYSLGSLYAAGAGVKRDDAEAVKWFRKAADQGKVGAQYILGYMLTAGEGVAKNETEGFTWYRKAAEQGLVDAQYAVGLAYLYGKGTTKDEQEANPWLRKAAEQNHVESAYLLGWNHETGAGVVPDYKEAARWYRFAADKGNVEAQYHLANLLRDGKGVQRNDAEALALYKKAAEQGQAYTTVAIDDYLKGGKPDAAFELADTWLAKHPDDVGLLTLLGFNAATEARKDAAKFGPIAKKYGEAAIAQIESGKKPERMADTEWNEYQLKWLPQLYVQLGSLSSKAGDFADARAKLERATELSPRDAYTWYLLGQTRFAEYEKLNADSKDLDGQARSDAVAQAFTKLDQVIDAYARAVGLSAGKEALKDLHDPLLKDLTNLYDFRNGSRNGLDQLIAKYKGS